MNITLCTPKKYQNHNLNKMKKLNEDIERIKNLMDLSENEDGEEDYFRQKYTNQTGPHDEDDMAPDGMDDDSDVDEEEIPESEISEEGEASAPASGGGSAGYPSVTKWESGRTLGPTYKGPNAKWESGIKRGKGNTLL
jgi:hypothetical protein